jgi:hypothetical protein
MNYSEDLSSPNFHEILSIHHLDGANNGTLLPFFMVIGKAVV